MIEVNEKNTKQEILEAWIQYDDYTTKTIQRLKDQRLQIIVACSVIILLYIL